MHNNCRLLLTKAMLRLALFNIDYQRHKRCKEIKNKWTCENVVYGNSKGRGRGMITLGFPLYVLKNSRTAYGLDV